MRATASKRHIVLKCREDGRIAAVVQWNIDFIRRPNPGDLLPDIVDSGSFKKAKQFIGEIYSKGTAFNWHMNISGESSAVSLSFSGVFIDDVLMVTGVEEPDFEYQNEFTRLNSELTNLQRDLIKEKNLITWQRNRLSSILTTIHVAVFEFDKTGNVRYANDAACMLLKISREQLEGRHYGEAFELRDEDGEVINRIHQIEKQLRIERGTINSQHVEESIPVSIHIVPVLNEHNAIVEHVVSISDISAIEQNSQMMIATSIQRTAKQITAGLVHNINNLMSIIIGHARRIEHKTDALEDSSLPESLVQILEAAWSAVSIADRMMYHTQEDMLQSVVLNLNEIVGFVIRDVELDQSIECILDLDTQAARIHTERGQIETLVYGLVHNAVEAMHEGGILRVATRLVRRDEPIDCTNESKMKGRAWELSVEDTGVGMDEETKARMFEPFFSQKFLGRGLGLAAVEGIVRAHNGCISVISEIEKGTAVKVYLPLDSGV